MRGEKLTVGFFPPLPWGSPPHARGKVCMFFKRTINAGITPACAGKSCDIVNQSHARGKGSLAADSLGARGITPACAGKSRQGSLGGACGWDHPRMRGEKPVFVAADRSPVGSPPHARGKDGVSIHDLSRRGITPACAGKRRLKTHSSSITWDHPRMRGEKKGVQVKRTDEQGSPPHARGKVDHGLFLERLNGITPACAGKSSSRLQTRFPVWDHPRMRGEKRKGNCTISARPGSPPHARGKVLGLEQKNPPEGITPACAGKSKE